jgi:hypothetical protein
MFREALHHAIIPKQITTTSETAKPIAVLFSDNNLIKALRGRYCLLIG